MLRHVVGMVLGVNLAFALIVINSGMWVWILMSIYEYFNA